MGAAVTEYHGLGGSDDKRLFLTVPEAGKFEMIVSAGRVEFLGKACFPGVFSRCLPWSVHKEGEREACVRSSFSKGTDPTRRAPPHNLSHCNRLPKTHFQLPPCWGLESEGWSLKGTRPVFSTHSL